MAIEIPDAQGIPVEDADGNVEEYLQVQNGPSLNRDGGPYGDQSDAIRDEKQNAAREGRKPDYSALVPDQYRVEPKSAIPTLVRHDVASLTRIVEPAPVAIPQEDVDYSKGELPENPKKEVIEPSEPGDPVNSEKVAQAHIDDII